MVDHESIRLLIKKTNTIYLRLVEEPMNTTIPTNISREIIVQEVDWDPTLKLLYMQVEIMELAQVLKDYLRMNQARIGISTSLDQWELQLIIMEVMGHNSSNMLLNLAQYNNHSKVFLQKHLQIITKKVVDTIYLHRNKVQETTLKIAKAIWPQMAWVVLSELHLMDKEITQEELKTGRHCQVNIAEETIIAITTEDFMHN
jgi:hypothetical protein